LPICLAHALRQGRGGALAYMDLGDKMKLDADMNKLDEFLIEYTKRKFSIELSHCP
jgi:hypothetical protein